MIKSKEFPDEVIDEVVKLYTNDKKISYISKELHISDTNVKRCLQKRNITLKGNIFGKLKWKHLDNILNKQFVIDKYNELLTIGELAKYFECGVDLIQKVFTIHNIKSREFHHIRELRLQKEREIPVNDENIIKAYKEDYLTIKEIEKKFRISHTKIEKILNKHNIHREKLLVGNKNSNKHILFNKDELTKLRFSGMSAKEVSMYIGCYRTTLQNALENFGIDKFNKTESRMNYMIKNIQTALPDFNVVCYDSNSMRFTIKHRTCNKIFEMSYSSVTSYKNNNMGGNERLCPHCNDRRSSSSQELEIRKILDENNITYLPSNRSLLGDRELDIYIPEKNLAIEFCGLYWHSDIFKNKYYHLDKLQRCEEKGIRLITIFEDEWNNKKELCIDKLKHILGITKYKKIYARKCKIININSKYRNTFLDKYHIQGRDKASVSYGLLYNDKIVAIASFSKLNIAKGSLHRDGIYELSRYATSEHVIGGLGKLISHFEINHTPLQLITYADKRWSDGNIYKKLGFTKQKDSKPNYWYMDNRLLNRFHRFNYRKSILKQKYPEYYNEELTELEITSKIGIRHIWDCGNMKFVKNYELSS